MQFNINVWLKLYNQLKTLNPYEDSREIEELKSRISYYLDSCGMFMPEALWKYEHNDTSDEKPSWRWISTACADPEKAEDWTKLNPHFAFEHLCT